jgi:splicing factor U2AF 65 kDa subunit
LIIFLNFFQLTNKQTKESEPTRILQLLNVICFDELTDGEFDFIIDDLRLECEKYGKVMSIKCPRPDPNRTHSIVGKVITLLTFPPSTFHFISSDLFDLFVLGVN